MRNVIITCGVLAALLLAGGCIVSDSLTTITILPDGSADWVRFQSNIRSTQTGLKGEQALQKFADTFDARQDADMKRIVESGGEILEARWIRNQKPFATVVSARFPTSSALTEFFTFRDEDGDVVAQPTFTIDGRRRKLALSIMLPSNEDAAPTERPTCEDLLARDANSISETRIAVADGFIVASQGFVIARDRASAVFDNRRLDELVRQRPERLELFLEWDVPAD